MCCYDKWEYYLTHDHFIMIYHIMHQKYIMLDAPGNIILTALLIVHRVYY